MASTIKEIAAKAGVSYQAVSAVLNGNFAKASAETRERIFKAAKELDYHPNAAARSLSSGKTKLIGFITQDIRFPFYSDLSYQVHAAAERHGYRVLMAESNWDDKRTEECLNMLISYSVDGILFIGDLHDKTQYKKILKRKIPMVIVDGVQEGFPGLLFDYTRGMEDCFKTLLEKGIRSIALAHDPGYPRKLDPYKAACEKFGVDVQEFHYRYPTAGGDAQVIECGRKIARSKKRPDALIAGADYDAALIIQGLASEGVKVPADISIVSIDDTYICKLLNPALAAIKLDREEMAEKAVGRLDVQIKNPDAKADLTWISTAFTGRQSVN